MRRVLISALSARLGGGMTYIRNIARSFPAGTGDRLTIISSVPIEDIDAHPDVEVIRAPSWTVKPIPRFLFGALYFRFFWPLRHSFDIVYYAGGSFDLELPPGIKRVVAFRNMLPFDPDSRRRYPLGWIRFRLWLLRFVQGSAFRKSDLVIFISEYARQVVDAAIPRRRGRSVVIPHGASHTAAPLDEALAARLPERFVLYLSILDVYKAQVELVEAWALLLRGGPRAEKLVLAGPENPYYGRQVREAIARHRLENEVVWLGSVPHDQVSDLASRATLNAFLSSCENCPNILLELLAVGRPLIVSARPPMPEFGGEGVDYVDPYDVAAIATGLQRLLEDSARMHRNAKAATARAPLYSWKRTGEATWSAILGL